MRVVGKFTPQLMDKDRRLIAQAAHHRYKCEIATYQWNPQPAPGDPTADASRRAPGDPMLLPVVRSG